MSDEIKHVEFTPQKLKDLKDSYKSAVKYNQDSFWFDGNEVITSYAKYLIEYLDMQFKKGGKR